MTIFCPSSHLLLAAARCPVCGWARPPAGQIGQPAWGPLALGAELGGPGRGLLAAPGVAPGVSPGVVVFPLASRVLLGLALADGRELWRAPLADGLNTHSLAPDDDRLLAALPDQRAIEYAQNGWLAAVDPRRGEITRLWDAGGHELTAPALAAGLILTRSAAHGLAALTRAAQPEVVWQQPLTSYSSLLPPLVAGGLVCVTDGRAMHGETALLAFSLADGAPRWRYPTDGLLGALPAVVQHALVFRNGRRQLTALAVESGALLWSQPCEHNYGGLCAGETSVYHCVRGAAPSGAPGHYALQALDPLRGETQWQADLPAEARPRSGPILHDGALYFGSDDGRILALSAADGRLLWEYTLGSDEEPIRTTLLPANGLLLAGTYSGRLVALRLSEQPAAPPDPADALARGDVQSAADAYALRGDFRRAAELYAVELGEREKALQLYRHAGLWEQAGDLARTLGAAAQAGEDYRRAGLPAKEALVLSEQGDFLGAARRFVAAGLLAEAAAQFEAAGEYREAYHLFRQLNRRGDCERLRPQLPLDPADVDELEQEGRLAEAGKAALKLGNWRKAADLLQRAGDGEGELAALEGLLRLESGAWAWQRLADLARALGRFHLEAQAWERLGRPMNAAAAFHRAARQAEARNAEDETLIGDLYEQAMKFYADAGLGEESQHCRAKVIAVRHLPWIVVEGKTVRAFRIGEMHPVELTVYNTGAGIAHNIRITIASSRFEMDATGGLVMVPRLAPGRTHPAKIHLLYRAGPTGEVPLPIAWVWQDHSGHEEQGDFCVDVTVHAADEKASSTPHIVNIGTLVQGDQFSGDKLEAGAQKGDKVEIQRGKSDVSPSGAASVQLSNVQPSTVVCPNCRLPQAADAQFCNDCGAEMPAAKPSSSPRKRKDAKSP